MPMQFSDRHSLLLWCAREYYDAGKMKKEIAAELGVSGTQVKRLLDEARARGIVQIKVMDRRDFSGLEEGVSKARGLRLVRVCRTVPNYEEQKLLLGQAAAVLFDEQAAHGSTVGVGGGGSIKAMVEALPSHPRALHLVPMALIGRGPALEHVDAAFLASLLCYKSAPTASASVVNLPPTPRKRADRRTYVEFIHRAIPEIRGVLDQARSASLAFVGLGGPEPVPEIGALATRESMRTTLRDASGGINYNYFDEDGTSLGHHFETLTIQDLQEMAAEPSKLLVLIAGGTHKRASLEIALRCRMASGLVTDEATALWLLEQR